VLVLFAMWIYFALRTGAAVITCHRVGASRRPMTGSGG